MRTLERAQEILADNPQGAMSDLIGIAAVVTLILVGFSLPAFL